MNVIHPGALILALLLGPAGQIPPQTVVAPTLEESLTQYKIQFSKPALVAALQSPEDEVRWLAAAKLAQDKVTETVPAILAALTAERVPRTRVNIALALAQLGERRGFRVLQDSCRDQRLRSWVRIQAATSMVWFLEREDRICRAALVQILQAQPDGHSLLSASSLLRRFHDLSEDESRIMLQAARLALRSPEDDLRLTASITLREMGDVSAIQDLETAITKEQSETIRSGMMDVLQSLKKKKQ